MSASKRKRKITPSGNAPAIARLIKGTRLRVWWPFEKKWFDGKIHNCETPKKKYVIRYDDGDVQTHDLSAERWELLEKVSARKRKGRAIKPKRLPKKGRAGQDKKDKKGQDSLNPFIQVRNAFHPSSMKKMTSCREAQVKAIESFFEGCLSDHIGGSLYLCGSPGTGKTASMAAIQKSLVVKLTYKWR